jgi:integrase
MAKRGNGEGAIYKRVDGRWVACLTLGWDQAGRRLRKTVYGSSHREVAARLADLAARHGQGLLVAPDKTTLAEWAAAWLERKRGALRAKTYASYSGLIRSHITPALGRHLVQSLRPAHVRAFLDALQHQRLAPRTQRHAASLLRAILEDAVAVELAPRNVARAVKVSAPRAERRAVTWEPGEVARFLEVARCDPRPANVKHSGREPDRQDPLYPAFYLLLTCGLRRGEALGLRWGDVDLDAGRLTIRQTLIEVNGRLEFSQPKTSNARRTLHLATDAVAVLTGHQARQAADREYALDAWQDQDLVFTTAIGTPVHPRNLVRSFDRLCTIAGVPRIRVHDLRHTHASLALRRGVPVEVVSERLGHHDAAITLSIYRHVFEGERKEAALSLNDLLATPGPRASA